MDSQPDLLSDGFFLFLAPEGVSFELFVQVDGLLLGLSVASLDFIPCLLIDGPFFSLWESWLTRSKLFLQDLNLFLKFQDFFVLLLAQLKHSVITLLQTLEIAIFSAFLSCF